MVVFLVFVGDIGVCCGGYGGFWERVEGEDFGIGVFFGFWVGGGVGCWGL